VNEADKGDQLVAQSSKHEGRTEVGEEELTIDKSCQPRLSDPDHAGDDDGCKVGRLGERVSRAGIVEEGSSNDLQEAAREMIR
jgi:hypothetical protein